MDSNGIQADVGCPDSLRKTHEDAAVCHVVESVAASNSLYLQRCDHQVPSQRMAGQLLASNFGSRAEQACCIFTELERIKQRTRLARITSHRPVAYSSQYRS